MITNDRLHENRKKRIYREFSTLPIFQGKIILTFEIDSGAGGVINKFKVKKFTEDEER